MMRLVAAIMLAAVATGAQAYQFSSINLTADSHYGEQVQTNVDPIFLAGGQEMLWAGWANENNRGHSINRCRLDGTGTKDRLSAPASYGWYMRGMYLMPGEERVAYWGSMNDGGEEHLYSITVNSVTAPIQLSLPLASSAGVSMGHLLADRRTIIYRQSAAGTGNDWFQAPGDASATALNWRRQLPAPYPYSKTIEDLRQSPDGRYFGFKSNAESTTPQVFAVPASFSRNPVMVSDPNGAYSALVGLSGDRIVYQQQLSSLGQPVHVFSRNADGTGPAARLTPDATNNTLFFPLNCISPDGRYVLTWGPYATAGVRELWAAPIAGGPVRRLTTFTHAAAGVRTSYDELVFTQDGSAVLYSADADVDYLNEVWCARLDGSEPPRRLTPAPTPGYFAYTLFGLSKDGQRLIFDARPDTGLSNLVYSVRIDGTESPRLLSHSANGIRYSAGYAMRLMPDGERFLFLSRAEGGTTADLTMGYVDGSAPAVQLSPAFSPSYGVRNFYLVPDSNRIVYTAFDNTTDYQSILTIVATPTMAEFAPIVTDNRGLPIGPLALELSDLETPADQIVVTATSSNQALLPDAALKVDKVDGEQFLTLHPVEAAYGDALVTLTATDADSHTTTTLVRLTVENTYQRPTLAPIAAEAPEDTPITLDAADFAAAFAHPAGHALERLRIDSLPAAGILRHDGLAVHSGDVLTTPAIALVYTPQANFNGTATFHWNATDGVLFADRPSSATLTLRPVDDPPALVQQPAAPPLSDDGATTFTLVSFGIVDPDSPLDAIQIHVTDGPTSGTLTPPTDFTLGQVDNGQVGYEFHGETHAPAQDSFRFRWRDPSKAATGGEATYIIDIPAGTNVRDRWIVE